MELSVKSRVTSRSSQPSPARTGVGSPSLRELALWLKISHPASLQGITCTWTDSYLMTYHTCESKCILQVHCATKRLRLCTAALRLTIKRPDEANRGGTIVSGGSHPDKVGWPQAKLVVQSTYSTPRGSGKVPICARFLTTGTFFFVWMFHVCATHLMLCAGDCQGHCRAAREFMVSTQGSRRRNSEQLVGH
eukprot:1161812-Pelagomonas_calceolata.AAC.5